MTKKYWNNWKKRFSETKNIYLFWTYRTVDGVHTEISSGGVLDYWGRDVIIDHKFDGDEVHLTIERHREVFDFSSGRPSRHCHTENEYVTLKREDIGRVEFKEKMI